MSSPPQLDPGRKSPLVAAFSPNHDRCPPSPLNGSQCQAQFPSDQLSDMNQQSSTRVQHQPYAVTGLNASFSSNNHPPTPTQQSSLPKPRFSHRPGGGHTPTMTPQHNAATPEPYLPSTSPHATPGHFPQPFNQSFAQDGDYCSVHSGESLHSSHHSGLPQQPTSQPQHHTKELPLCPNDSGCTQVNDKHHQRQYAHTCRLFPCFHAHIKYHAKLFRHVPGQAATPTSEGGSSNGSRNGGSPRAPTNVRTSHAGSAAVSSNNSNDGTDDGGEVGGSRRSHRSSRNKKQAKRALASVNFTHISRDVPNATKIIVVHGASAYEIFGDWTQVRIHTFKRYLHQVTGIRPAAQILLKDLSIEMTDDINTLAEEGVVSDTRIAVKEDESKAQATAALGSASATAASGGGKVPLEWL